MKYIIKDMICIETDAPEDVVKGFLEKDMGLFLFDFDLARAGYSVNKLSRYWFSQSSKDLGGYWAMKMNGGGEWVPASTVENGIEYTHNQITKPKQDAILVKDEINDEENILRIGSRS